MCLKLASLNTLTMFFFLSKLSDFTNWRENGGSHVVSGLESGLQHSCQCLIQCQKSRHAKYAAAKQTWSCFFCPAATQLANSTCPEYKLAPFSLVPRWTEWQWALCQMQARTTLFEKRHTHTIHCAIQIARRADAQKNGRLSWPICDTSF